jgi:hypothetical protein
MRNDCDFLSDTINKMKIGERKMKIGKIISEEIKKLIGKLTCKIQKVILYLYPEMTNFQEDIRKEKIKLKKEEILKIIVIVLIPFIIAGAYIFMPLKIVNAVFLVSYVLLVSYKTFKIYRVEKRINKRIVINILLLVFMIFFGTYTILK